ncbi:MAG: hypothetical protein JXJ20_13820 [Anaerolineae bacterium]|jgi:hypothetical protein|nr:hypothetical protein [Anaerolineae bacterium]
MQRYPDADRWSDRLARWSRRLHTLHLTEPVGTLLAAVEPLGPLGAQMLWIAQPTLGLFVPREDVAALARLLEAPEGMAWVREQLTGPDDESQ